MKADIIAVQKKDNDAHAAVRVEEVDGATEYNVSTPLAVDGVDKTQEEIKADLAAAVKTMRDVQRKPVAKAEESHPVLKSLVGILDLEG